MVLQSLMLANFVEQVPRLRAAQHSTHRHLVLCRYWPSGWVYGGIDGLPDDWLLRIQGPLPRADIQVLLDAPPSLLASRREERRSRGDVGAADGCCLQLIHLAQV